MNFENLSILGMWTPGILELTVILIIAVLIFGRRLPEIARGVGKSLTEFKKGIKEAKDVKDDLKEEVENAAGLDELKDENL
jgi:sec-independent protein translocase protein TatA